MKILTIIKIVMAFFFNINKLTNSQFNKINTFLDYCELSSQTDSDTLQDTESYSESY